MAKQAAEIIAFHLGQDLAEMKDYRYQPTVWKNPAVYTFGDDYWAAPASGKMPKAYCHINTWKCVGEEYGRKIFKAV
jgi:hypothetical protein